MNRDGVKTAWHGSGEVSPIGQTATRLVEHTKLVKVGASGEARIGDLKLTVERRWRLLLST
jgi:hypothetical protein